MEQEHFRTNDHTLTVDMSDDRGVWEGWGCSLCWWANVVGESRYEDLYADLFFTLREDIPFLDRQLPGLGMNIVRYNIGGCGRPGDPPAPNGAGAEKIPSDILPWYKQIEGYQPAPDFWDGDRDAHQRHLLRAAVARGVDQVELFSNAPMWWMTAEASSAGGALLPNYYGDFVRYLAEVAVRARDDWRVAPTSISPFNEPAAGWWTYPHRQEGCNISREVQAELLPLLRAEMDRRGLGDVAVAASDENTMGSARESYVYLQERGAAVTIGRVNVHAYNGLSPWRDNAARQALRAAVPADTPIWMSEYGDHDGSGMALAQTILEDVTHLRATAWVYWQPLEFHSAWGLVNGDFGETPDRPERGAATQVYTKYWIMAQFSRFLRPGYRVLGSNDPHSIIAHDLKGNRLILIVLNAGPARRITCDLAALPPLGSAQAEITATHADGSVLFQRSQEEVIAGRLAFDAAESAIYSAVLSLA